MNFKIPDAYKYFAKIWKAEIPQILQIVTSTTFFAIIIKQPVALGCVTAYLLWLYMSEKHFEAFKKYLKAEIRKTSNYDQKKVDAINRYVTISFMVPFTFISIAVVLFSYIFIHNTK
jgi:hypothetical protein